MSSYQIRDYTQHYPQMDQNKQMGYMNRNIIKQKIKRQDTNDHVKTRRQMKENNNISDIENQLPLKNLTKKIKKVAYNLTSKQNVFGSSTPRKPLRDVTNLVQGNSDQSSEKTPKVNFSFLEDDYLMENLNQGSPTIRKTYYHGVLNYVNKRTSKIFQFSCFLDRELSIPEKYSMKTIGHSIDNDVETDDDQIASAINTYQKEIRGALELNKQQQVQQQQL
ncbi:hypothetical protein PPERSA_02242 [Pseudocohnilembus persalinus]|uniref:Uncharacterized protein n=1 Tax=Pseudocohnilembus persalinus TaxID=266149 RepID=A0A0V0QL80_PSEPJ|nr:hypothetical protein PPERSA_02242 [Pseudocohnilembus persalinus]|eukprot:KRX02752.1 hypothetical protein PPERSA_02242 [Pseudocohnilembus persalinus]